MLLWGILCCSHISMTSKSVEHSIFLEEKISYIFGFSNIYLLNDDHPDFWVTGDQLSTIDL